MPPRRVPRSFALAGLSGTLLLAAGCASMKPTESGFLSSYSGMTAGKSDDVREFPPGPGALDGVSAFRIERPRWLAASGDGGRFEQDQREAVLTVLGDALATELGKLKPISSTSDHGTIVVRAAVTDAARSNPTVNVAMSLLVGPVTNGGATIELEAVDPEGIQIAAMVFADTGGFLDVFSAYSESGHAKVVAERAGKEFRKLLERSVKKDNSREGPRSLGGDPGRRHRGPQRLVLRHGAM